jgi:hypothetical protein
VGELLLGYHDDDDGNRDKTDAKEARRNINVNTNTPNQMLRNTRTYTHTIPYHTVPYKDASAWIKRTS